MAAREVRGLCVPEVRGVSVQLVGSPAVTDVAQGGVCGLTSPCPRLGSGFWAVSGSRTGGKGVGRLVLCSLVQWSAGPGGVRRSRDGRKNPSYRLGSETEEAFLG